MQTNFINPAQLADKDKAVDRTKYPRTAFAFGIALVSVLTSCVGYVEGPRHHSRVYAEPPPVYVQSEVVVHDDYVYYPGYEVYYSGTRRQYVYREGSAWVSRPAPPRVGVDVLLSSPSVRVDFHDAPAAHHASVVQSYPKNWTPPGWNHGNKGGNRKD
jgi:hypothetical protein